MPNFSPHVEAVTQKWNASNEQTRFVQSLLSIINYFSVNFSQKKHFESIPYRYAKFIHY